MIPRSLERRAFLRFLGVGASVPLAMRMARLAGAQSMPRPTRLFLMYIPHGMPDEHFDPGSTLALDPAGPRVLDALGTFQKYVTLVRGISMNAGASNHAAIEAVFTGFPGGAADSIDFSIAKALNVTPYVVGAVPYASGSGFTSDSFLFKHGDWVSPTASPATAADTMLKGVGSGPNPMPMTDESAFRKEALALTERELENLQGALTGLTSEQTKLAAHLTAIRNLKATAGMPPSGGGKVSCTSTPALPAVAAIRGLNPLDQKNFGLLVDAHLEAAATAILCNSARVIGMQNMWAQSDLNFGFQGGPGVAEGHHDPVSHSWDAPGRDAFRKCQRWFFERLAAKFLALLDVDDPSDPGRKVLDNTTVLVLSEVSDGAEHNSDASTIWVGGKEQPSYLPCVLIGGGGGYFKPGRVVDVKRSHIDVLATVSDAMGVPVTKIGSQTVSAIRELKA